MGLKKARNIFSRGVEPIRYTEMIFTAAAFPVADPNDVADWNTLMVQSGTPYASVLVTGDTVRLEGGANIFLKDFAFFANLDITSIIDTGCISIIGESAFDCATSAVEGNLVTASFSRVTEFSTINFIALQFTGQTHLTNVNFPLLGALTDYCFADCALIEEAYFPSVTFAGGYCFSKSGVYPALEMMLRSFEAPLLENVADGMFVGCENFETYIIPQVTSIGSQAFSTTKISSVNFPNVLTVGGDAFAACLQLVDAAAVNLPLATNVSGFYVCTNLAGIMTLPSCTYFENSAFSGCSLLEKVIAPVTRLGISCFRDCIGLIEANYPLVTIIDISGSLGEQFRGCSSLPSINIPIWQGTSITDFFCLNCVSLTSITVGSYANVTYIGNSAFSGCSSLVLNMTGLFANVVTLGGAAFAGTPITGEVVMNSVTTFVGGVFSNCNGITKVTMNGLLTITGGSNFINCTGVTEFVFPNLTSISAINASQNFRGCTGVSTFSFPSLTTISGALSTSNFQNCVATLYDFPILTDLANGTFNSIAGVSPIVIHLDACVAVGTTVLNNNVFQGVSGKTITLYIPASRMTANAGAPDGDIAALQAANTVTVITT
jgi:hypothetical protein